MIDRDSIKAATKRKTELVDVPEWGGKVLVRAMNVLEQEQFWDILDDARKGVQAPAGKRGSVVLNIAMDESGKPLFTAEDAAWIGEQADQHVIDRIFNVIQRLSGTTTEAQADIEKKLETTTSSSSIGLLIDGDAPTSTS